MFDSELLSHLGFTQEDYIRTCVTLQAKEDQAKQRLYNHPFPSDGIYTGHSGGKDSVVVQYLADQCLTCPTVHTPKFGNSANQVHALTRQFLYQQPRIIQYVPANLHSTLGYRTQIDGTRIAEFSRQDGRSTTFIYNGQERSREELTEYVPNGLFGLNFIFPIYDWSDLEVWSFILDRKIPFSKEYLPWV